MNGATLQTSDPMALPETLRGLVTGGLMRLDNRGRVQVYIEAATSLGQLGDAVKAFGGEVQRAEAGTQIVQAWVPITVLETIAADTSVEFVRLPTYPMRNTGSVTSQGDTILRAFSTRFNYPVTGAGVRIGVISDGLQGLSSSVGSGDLPGSVNYSTCNVVPQSPTSAGAGAEGTAMLEIVHDLAPGAALWFGHFGYGFGGTSLDFQAAVNCLAANTDVVVDDIGFFNNGPYDGTSPISLNASNALNGGGPIRAYVTAVGNQALRHYEETYVDYNGGGSLADVHQFASIGNTTDACALGPGPADPILVPAGGTVTVALQWNDTFGASANDYDLYLVRDDTGTTVASSAGEQNGNDDPTEILGYLNNTGATRQFDIIIDRFAGGSRAFDMFILGSALTVGPPACAGGPSAHNYNTPGSSVPNNSDAGGGVISAGTVNASNVWTVASYSSRGPTNDFRTKPDITGVDGVYIKGSGGFPSPFYGTSAAAPHLAAITALLLQCKPELRAGEPGDNPVADRDGLRGALINGSIDLLPAGVDNISGWGRADALNSADEICPTPFGPPSHGNLLVTSSLSSETHTLFEYAPGGSLVQKARVLRPGPNDPGANVQYLRDHTLQPDGKIAIYDGNNVAAPLLTTYNPASRTWTHHSAQDWSVDGNGWYGGIASFQNYVFVTDAGPGATDNGIIRFNVNDYSWERFGSTPYWGLQYWDVTLGLDGLLYAVTVEGRALDVYDPITLQRLKTINLYIGSRNVAVDGAGYIFGATGDGAITHFGRNGELLDRILVGQITDINISPTDELATGGVHTVYLSDTSLAPATSFQVPNGDSIFVSFVRYPQPGDVDADSIADSVDNCPGHANINQADSDGDGPGDACDPDDDNDTVQDLDDNCPEGSNSGQSDADTDSYGDVCDNCPETANFGLLNTDGDGLGDTCDPDDDNDFFVDTAEVYCGSYALDAASIPERIDTPGDDDGDTLVNEGLSSSTSSYDCDGDGFTGSAENHVFNGAGGRDQDRCGNNGWPAELFTAGASANTLNLSDLASFIAPLPRKLNTSPGDPGYDVRWDLVPGAPAGKQVNLVDVSALTASSAATANPPMFGGARAFGGPACPWPP